MNIHISNGNSKLGSIPSISLPPVKTCGDVLCAKDCYALNITKRFKHVKGQWEENLNYYKTFPTKFFGELFFWLVNNKPSHFRFHVGGDCPDKAYLEEVYCISRSLPHIKFMMFTKRYDWVDPNKIPNNLAILLSIWPYMKQPTNNDLANVWVRGDLRVPEGAFVCKGVCTECFQCWNKKTKNILLKGH